MALGRYTGVDSWPLASRLLHQPVQGSQTGWWERGGGGLTCRAGGGMCMYLCWSAWYARILGWFPTIPICPPGTWVPPTQHLR